MTNTLTPVTFHGATLLTSRIDNEPFVAMKPICDNIGIGWRGQHERIQRHSVLSKGMRVIRTPSKGGLQNTVCLPLNKLNGWLFGIDSNRIKKPETKAKVIKYQEECFDVLARHFGMENVQQPPLHEILNIATQIAVALCSDDRILLYKYGAQVRHKPVPSDASVRSKEQWIKDVGCGQDLSLTTEQLIQIINNAQSRLHDRAQFFENRCLRRRKQMQ